MRKRIGTKIYDTDKAVLVDTLDDGVQVYRKKNSPLFFIYNPNGKTGSQMFFDLPADQVEKYMAIPDEADRKVFRSSSTIQFSKYDRDRIKRLANTRGMSMASFLLMLVDEYERTHTDRGN